MTHRDAIASTSLYRPSELLDILFGVLEGEGVTAGAEHVGGHVFCGDGEDALELCFGEDASGAGVGGEDGFLEREGIFREGGEFFGGRTWQRAVGLGEVEIGGVEGGGVALKELGDVEAGVVFATGLGDVLVEGEDFGGDAAGLADAVLAVGLDELFFRAGEGGGFLGGRGGFGRGGFFVCPGWLL